ncbi:hypothetical protein [Kitasatospora sp. NPDC057541]|uniref:hypothetical protein n=1 Tax=unclassified Kitasatospora TaxID=2633591 RepID=UPI003695A1CE
MTDTLRTRLARTALDTADSIATVTAGAAAGLTTYRTLTARPTEIRITLALAAGTLWAALGKDLAIAELRGPAADGDDQADEDNEDEDVDQEAEAHAAGLL